MHGLTRTCLSFKEKKKSGEYGNIVGSTQNLPHNGPFLMVHNNCVKSLGNNDVILKGYKIEQCKDSQKNLCFMSVLIRPE